MPKKRGNLSAGSGVQVSLQCLVTNSESGNLKKLPIASRDINSNKGILYMAILFRP